MKNLASMFLLSVLLSACGSTGGGGGGPGGGNQNLTARIEATPMTGTAPLTVQFSGAGSTASPGTVSSHAWKFGDGATGAGVGTSHTYAAGTWTASLTVTDSFGKIDSTTVTITATGESGTPDPDPGPDSDPDPAEYAAGALLTYGLTADRAEVAEDATSLMLEAVLLASDLATGGQELVVTGTLTQSGAAFTYSPSPADRLLVRFSNGNQVEVKVNALDGDENATSPAQFLRKPHTLNFAVARTIDGVTDSVAYASQRGGGEFV